MRQIYLSVMMAGMGVVLAFVAGCQGPVRPAGSGELCAGKATIDEAVAALAAQRGQLGAMQASARCVMQWRDDKDKSRQESFDAQVRFVPPDRMFFRGDKFGEIRFGANETEFWLRVKAELDTYWWGRRQQAQDCAHTLMLNPCNLAEAMGSVEVDSRWELFHRKGQDLLTLTENGRPVKRVFVNCCDYRVHRIEYFDSDGQASGAAELSNYTRTNDGLEMPMTIRVITLYRGREESSAQFELKGAKRFEASPEKMNKLFERPGRDGYGTVLRLDANCNFEEETQTGQ